MLNDMHLVPDINIDPSTSATWKSQPQHFSLSCHEQQQQQQKKCLRLASLKFSWWCGSGLSSLGLWCCNIGAPKEPAAFIFRGLEVQEEYQKRKGISLVWLEGLAGWSIREVWVRC